MSALPAIDSLWSDVTPDKDGLVPCVTQDLGSGAILMVAWVNKLALGQALESGYATYWSRSRKEVWEKGLTSGHRQKLVHVRIDCDGDTLLYVVDPKGPACHLGTDTCFSKRRVGAGWNWEPQDVLDAPGIAPRSYLAKVSRLVEAQTAEADSDAGVLAKAGLSVQAARIKEDSEQLAHALGADGKDEVSRWAAEILFDLAIALRARDVPYSTVLEKLQTRDNSRKSPKDI